MNEETVPQYLPDWIVSHAISYIRSNGTEGHWFDSSTRGGDGEDDGLVPTLLIETTGRKTGKKITIPVIYGKIDDVYVIIGSRGGTEITPSWYLNLCENPRVKVQVATDSFIATSRTAEGRERESYWNKMLTVLPRYQQYQDSVERIFPVVVLERLDENS